MRATADVMNLSLALWHGCGGPQAIIDRIQEGVPPMRLRQLSLIEDAIVRCIRLLCLLHGMW
eukprot:12307640-Karenia_brevis.AAC.1